MILTTFDVYLYKLKTITGEIVKYKGSVEARNGTITGEYDFGVFLSDNNDYATNCSTEEGNLYFGDSPVVWFSEENDILAATKFNEEVYYPKLKNVKAEADRIDRCVKQVINFAYGLGVHKEGNDNE